MGRNRSARLRLALAMTLAMLGSGCLGGPAPRDHFYPLEVGAPQAVLAEPIWAGTVEVDRPRADALTRERAMLFRESDASVEVQRYGYHKWIDSPTLLVQRELVAYLRESGAAKLVVTPEMRLPSNVTVSGRLLRLVHGRAASPPRVVVELELVVTETKSRKLLLQGTYREERQTSGEDIATAVGAFEDALTSIFERFLADASG